MSCGRDGVGLLRKVQFPWSSIPDHEKWKRCFSRAGSRVTRILLNSPHGLLQWNPLSLDCVMSEIWAGIQASSQVTGLEVGFPWRERGKLPLWWPYSQEIPGECYYTPERMLCFEFVIWCRWRWGICPQYWCPFLLQAKFLFLFSFICPIYLGLGPFGLDLQVWISFFCSIPSVMLGGFSLFCFYFFFAAIALSHTLFMFIISSQHIAEFPLIWHKYRDFYNYSAGTVASRVLYYSFLLLGKIWPIRKCRKEICFAILNVNKKWK